MESALRAAYSEDDSDGYGNAHSDDEDGDCSMPYGAMCSRYSDMPRGRSLDILLLRSDGWKGPLLLQESPITELPADMWCLITTYLPMSDVMSLRCTARVVQKHLKVVTDAIRGGCRMIAHLAQDENVRSRCSPASIEKLLTLRLEARCDMIKRYARQAGLSCHVLAVNKVEPSWALKCRYFAQQCPPIGSEHQRSMRSWRMMIDTTNAALCVVTLDATQSIPLCDLFAADMYAPLLGVISDPAAHIRNVMDKAAATLSTLRWMDFLYAVEPLKELWPPIGQAYRALNIDFDHTYPMPRIEVFSAIVRAAIMGSHGASRSVREMCLERIRMSPECLAEQILPCVTRSLADWVVVDRFARGFDLCWQLKGVAQKWGDDDGSFVASLHHSLLTALAKRAYGDGMPWSMLAEPTRVALCTRVLGIPACDSALYGLTASRMPEFWRLYFEITDPRPVPLSPSAESRIDALPWPLQAVLWRIASDIYADPARALRGDLLNVYQEMSSARVDSVCNQAMDVAQHAFAIPAMQALFRWKVTRACEAVWDATEAGESPACSEEISHAVRYPEFTAPAWAVFERCTRLERLPFVAALFSYRRVLARCGYDWTYEAVISQDVVTFLCDPHAQLTCPSSDIINVLLHYLPSCKVHLPEYRVDPDGWELAFVKRFDLSSADVAYALHIG
ncbi:hypothetical protein [Robbsia sp. KACC 23696]|uniref:hypothetical protein n=1 Tax=Robbsia sp. KACC 23696 TaxID=3149231 RepID=UPI00325BCBC5